MTKTLSNLNIEQIFMNSYKNNLKTEGVNKMFILTPLPGTLDSTKAWNSR